MPSTLIGLIIAVYVLIPGYCYYAVRRRLIPIRRVTTLVDAGNAIFVATITNTLILTVYGVTQVLPWIRDHSPNVVQLLRNPEDYLLHSNSRLAYVGMWAVLLLVGSSILAIVFALRSVPHRRQPRINTIRKWWDERYPARVTDVSVWDYHFHHVAPDDSEIYLECHLHNGSYVAGTLAWYNTDIDDSPDRDLVLSRPLTVTSADGSELVEQGHHQQAILSAREISEMIVTYISSAAIDTELERRSNLATEYEESRQEDKD